MSKINDRLPKERRDRYTNFLQETDKPWCWACGCTRPPRLWHAPFLIERAHIVNKPRMELREVANLLCSLCHKVQGGDGTLGRPPITLANMVWIKMVRDPEYFSIEELNQYSVRRMPEPEELEAFYLHSYHKLRS